MTVALSPTLAESVRRRQVNDQLPTPEAAVLALLGDAVLPKASASQRHNASAVPSGDQDSLEGETQSAWPSDPAELAQLEAELERGLNSGSAITVDAEYWARKCARLTKPNTHQTPWE